jgi:hypothetical protein
MVNDTKPRSTTVINSLNSDREPPKMPTMVFWDRTISRVDIDSLPP